jgi:hypothetical protein
MEEASLAAKRKLLQDLWHLNRRLDGVALALENSGQALGMCAETQRSLNQAIEPVHLAFELGDAGLHIPW